MPRQRGRGAEVFARLRRCAWLAPHEIPVSVSICSGTDPSIRSVTGAPDRLTRVAPLALNRSEGGFSEEGRFYGLRRDRRRRRAWSRHLAIRLHQAVPDVSGQLGGLSGRPGQASLALGRGSSRHSPSSRPMTSARPPCELMPPNPAPLSNPPTRPVPAREKAAPAPGSSGG